MAKVSIVIPARNERFLAKTIDDIFAKATGEVEVLAVLDGYWPDPPLKERPGLVIIHQENAGMRPALNNGLARATGKYVMKCDAHILFDYGFDEKLQADCDDDWLVIPRRVSLDPENWCIAHTGKPPVDYEFLSYAWEKPNELGWHGNVWSERAKARRDKPEYMIDDNPTMQGSCWFMPRDLYMKRIHPFQCYGYGNFVQDPQELSFKIWLSGGRVAVNKKVTYAHLHKGKTYGRGYFIDKRKMVFGLLYSVDYWMNNSWPGQTRKFEWLIDYFWPMPTWPENWKEIKHPRLLPDFPLFEGGIA